MRRSALVVLGALILVAAFPLFGKPGFSGTYSVSGTNPGVGRYTGTLTITPRGEVYDVRWSIAGTSYGGVGIANGDMLSVAYTGGDHTWFGVVTYKQSADGTLNGRWAVAGASTTPGTETATRK